MASSSSNPNSDAAKTPRPRPRPLPPSSSSSSSISPSYDMSRTTYVQADPSNFRAVVQRLTGPAASSASSVPLPIAARLVSNLAIASMSEIGPRRRPPFKLHERRQSARKLEISLGARNRGFVSEKAMVSPASTLDLLTQESPRSPATEEAEEEEEEKEKKAIAAKGYYFRPNIPRGSKPELLPLFPLKSPRNGSSSHS